MRATSLANPWKPCALELPCSNSTHYTSSFDINLSLDASKFNKRVQVHRLMELNSGWQRSTQERLGLIPNSHPVPCASSTSIISRFRHRVIGVASAPNLIETGHRAQYSTIPFDSYELISYLYSNGALLRFSDSLAVRYFSIMKESY